MGATPLKRCPRCGLYRCACPVVGHVEPARGIPAHVPRILEPQIARLVAIEAQARALVKEIEENDRDVAMAPAYHELRRALGLPPAPEETV